MVHILIDEFIGNKGYGTPYVEQHGNEIMESSTGQIPTCVSCLDWIQANQLQKFIYKIIRKM